MTPAWFSSNGALVIADSPVEVGINQPPANYPRFKWNFATDGAGLSMTVPFHDPDMTRRWTFHFQRQCA